MKNQLFLWGQAWIEKGAWFFAPLSWIWGFVSFGKNFLYDRKILRIIRVPCPVISIGNIVAGGTGKTPLVHLLASRFSYKRIAILSRGYGKIPDEPMLLQRRLPFAKIYVGKDRVKLGRQAITEGAELILLDDGFQYRRLHRDFELVVLSGEDLFGKGHYLPWGFLRDSPKRLRCADAIFVSGQSEPLAFEHISLQLKVNRILDFHGNLAPSLINCSVVIFSGIAKPAIFKKTVQSLKVTVLAEWGLADHEAPSLKQLAAFAKRGKSLGACAILCTEKDFIKLDPSLQLDLPIYFLEISFSPSEELWEKLVAKISQKIDNFKYYE